MVLRNQILTVLIVQYNPISALIGAYKWVQTTLFNWVAQYPEPPSTGTGVEKPPRPPQGASVNKRELQGAGFGLSFCCLKC